MINSQAGCQRELSKRPARPADRESYSIAEMIFKSEKGSGLGHQELRDDDGRTSLVLCATHPEPVRTLEKLFDLPE